MNFKSSNFLISDFLQNNSSIKIKILFNFSQALSLFVLSAIILNIDCTQQKDSNEVVSQNRKRNNLLIFSLSFLLQILFIYYNIQSQLKLNQQQPLSW